MPYPHGIATKDLALCCGLLFVSACTGYVGPSEASGEINQAGSGAGEVSSGGAGGSAAHGASGAGGAAGTDDPGTIVTNPPAFAPAPGQLRRLTRGQFRNAVRDVFGYEVDVTRIDADSWTASFASIGAASVVTSERGVEQYHTAIESAVADVFSDPAKRSKLIGCTPTGLPADACIRGFVERLGLRAWRRPLDGAEIDRLDALAATAATALDDALEGARWATVALFTSPSFLYRTELGAVAESGALRFTGYEMASRLSFLIWNSLPDQLLLDQAQSGMLDTPEGIRAAATRMLDVSAGRESVAAFADELMRLDRIAAQAKDPALFPEYGPDLQAGMVRDIRDTWASVAFDDQASALDLFTTTKVIVNADLARLYGLDATGLTSTTFETRSLPADGPRAGLLSKAGFLSLFANQKAGSPTLRGKFIREAMMCLPIPPPPPDVNTAAVDQPSDLPMTRRQKLEEHRTNPACAGCHALMDPLGLPLETFDAIGKYRTTDNGLSIDTSSMFDDGQAIADARGLGVAASQSVEVAQCLVRKYYSYAMGYEERAVDGSALNTVATAFEASGFKLRELILAVVTNEAFASVAPQL